MGEVRNVQAGSGCFVRKLQNVVNGDVLIKCNSNTLVTLSRDGRRQCPELLKCLNRFHTNNDHAIVAVKLPAAVRVTKYQIIPGGSDARAL